MKLIDKLKNIFANNKTTSNSDTLTPPNNQHHSPLTMHIMAWLDRQNWRYEHRKPDNKNKQTHHIILNFTDNTSDWTCVFRINEGNQLISMFGVLPDTIPPSHFAPMLMKIAHTNTNIAFGSLELDPTDGEIRTKMSVDAEFSTLSDKSLGCYLQGTAGLVELAQRLYDDVLSEAEPSPFWHDYLPDISELHGYGTQEYDDGVFMPTQVHQ